MPVEVESGADPLYSGDQVPVIQGARIGASEISLCQGAGGMGELGRSYDESPDGRRFLIALTKDQPTSVPTRMIVVRTGVRN